jgi:hypothetical protein
VLISRFKEVIGTQLLATSLQRIDTESSWFSIIFSFQKNSRVSGADSIFSEDNEPSDVPNRLSGFLAFFKFTPDFDIDLVGIYQESTFQYFNQLTETSFSFWHGKQESPTSFNSSHL